MNQATSSLFKSITSLQGRKTKYNSSLADPFTVDKVFKKFLPKTRAWMIINFPETKGKPTIGECKALEKWLSKNKDTATHLIQKARTGDLIECIKEIDMTDFDKAVRPWVFLGTIFLDWLAEQTSLERFEVSKRLTMIASKNIITEIEMQELEGTFWTTTAKQDKLL